MLYFCKNFKKMSQFTENVAKYGSCAISLFFNSQGGRSPSFEVFKLDMYASIKYLCKSTIIAPQVIYSELDIKVCKTIYNNKGSAKQGIPSQHGHKPPPLPCSVKFL